MGSLAITWNNDLSDGVSDIPRKAFTPYHVCNKHPYPFRLGHGVSEGIYGRYIGRGGYRSNYVNFVGIGVEGGPSNPRTLTKGD